MHSSLGENHFLGVTNPDHRSYIYIYHKVKNNSNKLENMLILSSITLSIYL